jgi:hypothetical protein
LPFAFKRFPAKVFSPSFATVTPLLAWMRQDFSPSFATPFAWMRQDFSPSFTTPFAWMRQDFSPSFVTVLLTFAWRRFDGWTKVFPEIICTGDTPSLSEVTNKIH